MTTSAELAMIGLVVVPLAAAVAVFVSAGRSAAAWSMGAAAVQFGLVVWLTRSILEYGPLRHRIGGWEAPLGIPLYADGIAALMLIMTAVVGSATTIYAVGYFSAAQHGHADSSNQYAEQAFWPLWLMLWSALNALFLSGDIFNLYVTLELITLSAVALIGLAGRARALVAAMRYLIAALVGSLFYLLGVALMYSAYGTVSWQLLGELVRGDAITLCAAVLMIVGLLLKTALFPLHFWLPDAHANAPAPVSGLLSGLVLKASFFIIFRLWFFVFAPLAAPGAGQLLSGLGAAAILWGSLQAIRQQRVKRMIAYSTVAQIGYLFLVFGLSGGATAMLAWRGAAYFAFAHACAKTVAFMVAGSLMHAAASDELDRWEGIGRREPMLMFAFGLAGVSLMGLPPSGGFIAKWLLLNAAVGGGHWFSAVVMLVGGLLAAVYVFRVVAISLSSSAPQPATAPIPPVMRWPPLALAVVVVVCGIVTTEPIRLLDVGSPFAAATEAAP
jgi:formate hydrogenlyase subunit 3/multisubunit Na+/H+ antiporter MnhD subunit